MTRIGFVGSDSFDRSGIGKVSQRFAQHFKDKEGVEVDFVDYRFLPDGVPFSITLNSLFPRPGFKPELKAKDFDKVFVPSQVTMMFDPSEIDAEVIVYVHDTFPVTGFYKFEERRGWMYRNVFSLIGSRVRDKWMRNLVKADKFLTGTEFVKNDLIRSTPVKEESVFVVGQGVDDLPEIDIDFDRVYDVVYVGSTIGRKNPEFLQDALQRLVDKGFEVVTVSGSDLPGESFEDLSDKNLAELYCKSRFFLHPSYAEGFGRCPVEAQRYGCIPLAFDREFNDEVLGGEYFEVDSVRGVLHTVDTEYEDSYRENCRRNAKRYTWSKTLNKADTVMGLDE